MCGISGFLDLQNGVDLHILQAMTDVIRHRGPDDEGYCLFSGADCRFYGGSDTMAELCLPPLAQGNGAEAFLGFGHRRLSILDLSRNGHQPMRLPEYDLTVTYNGEIYNYLELRQELTALGCTFHTSCDTEVLLHAYRVWGEDCLSHFNGMWGFALWDGANNRLFCARDRLGAKPFYYWHEGDRMLFGSELKQLCQHPGLPHRFNPDTLTANLIFSDMDFDDQTLIEGFYLLRPGHKLTVQLSPDRKRIASFDVAPYWTLDTTCDESLTLEDWKERVSAAFAQACRYRLRSDAPLSALLSGGLDSSCLVAEVCSQLPDPARLETFTTSYPDRADCDEWKFADMVNRACGCRGNRILPDPKEGIEQLYEDCIWHSDGPAGLNMLGPVMLLREIRRRGYKVVLNGQCGDETMFGYDWYYAFYLADLLRKGRLRAASRAYREITQHSNLSVGKLGAGLVYYNVPSVRTARKLHMAKRYVSAETLRERDRRHAQKYLTASSLEDIQRSGLTTGSLTMIVRHDDRMYMSASLESRLPFMDYEFVELAAKIPPRFKIHNGYTKSIMREVFDSRLPHEVNWRTDKMGFLSPTDRFAGRFSREYLLDRIKHARTAAYFNTDALTQMAQDPSRHPELFQFLQTEIFARRFDVD